MAQLTAVRKEVSAYPNRSVFHNRRPAMAVWKAHAVSATAQASMKTALGKYHAEECAVMGALPTRLLTSRVMASAKTPQRRTTNANPPTIRNAAAPSRMGWLAELRFNAAKIRANAAAATHWFRSTTRSRKIRKKKNSVSRMAWAPPERHVANVPRAPADRKSTRLNSSHLGISYAVFCLKKKK